LVAYSTFIAVTLSFIFFFHTKVTGRLLLVYLAHALEVLCAFILFSTSLVIPVYSVSSLHLRIYTYHIRFEENKRT
jgi:hypothetical protein